MGCGFYTGKTVTLPCLVINSRLPSHRLMAIVQTAIYSIIQTQGKVCTLDSEDGGRDTSQTHHLAASGSSAEPRVWMPRLGCLAVQACR